MSENKDQNFREAFEHTPYSTVVVDARKVNKTLRKMSETTNVF